MDMQDLKQLASTLNAALNGSDDDGTGWGDAPSTSTIVYLSRRYRSLWYTWDHDAGDPVTIEHEALTGHVGSPYLKDQDGEDGIVTMLRMPIDTAEGTYTLHAGASTVASRQLLKGLMQADPALPVTIVPREADKESVIFVEVWQDGSRIDIDYDDDRSGERLLVDLCDALDIEFEHYELQPPARAQQPPAAARQQSRGSEATSDRISRMEAKLERLEGDALADAIATLKTWQPDPPLSAEENNRVADIIDRHEGPSDTFEPDDDLPF